MDITAGGDFLGLCDQKNSFTRKHVSDLGRLRSYGHFLIPQTPSCEPRLTEPAGGVMYSTWWLIACVASIVCHVTRAVHNPAAACFAAGCGILENQL